MAFLTEVTRTFSRLTSLGGGKPDAYPDAWVAPGPDRLTQDAPSSRSVTPSTMLRRVDRSEGSGSAGNRDLGVKQGDLKWWQNPQETRRDLAKSVAMGAVVAGSASVATRRTAVAMAQDHMLRQKLDAARDGQYDFGRLQAEMQELATRFPEHAGQPNAQKPTDHMPMQTIYAGDGRILMQGRAESVEHLIALKLDEAAKTTDPNKQVVNLAGAQLDEKTLGRKLDLNGLNLQGVDLRGANLSGANITNCQIKNVDMTGASLQGTTIYKCHMESVTMTEFAGDKNTTFRSCSLYNVAMNNADAPGMKMEGIRAEYIDMAGSNFAGATWSDMKVSNLWANNINLEGARLGHVAIAGPHSSFENARMANIQVGLSSFGTPGGAGVNMKGVQAPNSTWTDVQFNKSDLSRSDFSGASFTRVDMREVVTPEGPMNMQRATLSGLVAGEDAKMKAQDAVVEGITMKPVEDFVFSGTTPLKRAADAALSAGSLEAKVLTADGATMEALQSGVMSQVAPPAQRTPAAPTPLMAPAPPSPFKKKGGGF